MKSRLCNCDRVTADAPYTDDQCWPCWLWHNNATYRGLRENRKTNGQVAPWTVRQQLAGVAKAAFRFVRSGFAWLPTEQVAERQAICDACEHWKGKCLICGCRRIKLELPGERCPILKWLPLPVGEPTIKSWAVGVTTAPRSVPTLNQTLASLGKAGWTEATVFDDPVKEPTDYLERNALSCSWNNWFRSLSELYESGADCIMLVQDDVVFSRGLKTFLSYDLWPAAVETVGCVSLYCSQRYCDPNAGEPLPDAGCSALNPKRELWGALALCFPRHAVAKLLVDPHVHLRKGNRIDQRIRGFCTRAGLGLYVYRPSFAQHIGEQSTLGHGTGGAYMSAGDFLGEDADVTALLTQ